MAKAGKPAVKKPIVVCLTLDGEYPEGPGSPGIFGELEPSLGDIVRRIDAAAADKDVLAVWLKIEDLAVGRAKICELRGAIARLRKANKPVYAELTSADTGQYLLATACDQIVMPPSGVLVIPGVRAEITFYKGLLDKLGLEFDILKMGKYKGAAEPFTRKDMSQPLRESYESLVDDFYQDMLGTIAANRSLKDYQVKTYVDRGLFSAEDAKKAGLIDQVLYSDQLEDAIEKKLNVEKIEIVTDYKKNKIDADFSGLSGMIKLIEILTGGKPSGGSRQEAENRRGLRRRPDRRGQEQQRAVQLLRVGIDLHDRRAAQGRRRSESGGHRVADRQPWRIGHGQRPDLARNRAHPQADHRQHGRRGRQRRLLHRHGRQEDLRRARHPDRLDRRDRRQAGHARAVRQTGPEQRGHRPRRQQRSDVVRTSRSRPASGRSGSKCCRTRTTSSSARPRKAGR